MMTQFNRFCGLLLIVVAGSTQPAMATPSPLPPHHSVRAPNQVDWLSTACFWIDVIHYLIGGDPEKIRAQTSLQGKFGVVAEHYATSGIPATLSQSERTELVSAIDSLYSSLSNPPPEAPPINSANFRKILELMWVDLGQPLEDLFDCNPPIPV